MEAVGCIEGHPPNELDKVVDCLQRRAYVRLVREDWALVPDLGEQLRRLLPIDFGFKVKVVGKWIWIHARPAPSANPSLLDDVIDY